MRRIDLKDFQVATRETARDINRRIVLNLIRSHQPVSRADLARHSGLQRSTVSVIAEQLITEKWVKEGAVGHTVRGRRPPFLHLNKEHIGILGVDIRPAIIAFELLIHGPRATSNLQVLVVGANYIRRDSRASRNLRKGNLKELRRKPWAWRIRTHAAIGVWYSRRQCRCQRYDLRLAPLDIGLFMPSPPAAARNRSSAISAVILTRVLRVVRPGGVRAVVAETILTRHQ